MNMVASVFRLRTDDGNGRAQFFASEPVVFSKLDENNAINLGASLEVRFL
ncbi:unnamed protein product [Gongylonema pulchrum]|uniref:Pirin_C_2 domain-containing protein n=1 Tax=Gongylonema pulchrum TaxID=637853 RepID=A0A183DJK7_9BILA|nr:unnamed protein product [Gongylonema pulchrum]